MAKFEDIAIGDKAELSHVITQADIDHFVGLTGDDNKLHVDEEYARQTSFKKPVAHGMLSASFISTLIGTKLPGDGALWFSQKIEFLKPVRVGDTITIRAEVMNKFEKTRTIELSTDIFNQHNQKVASGAAKVNVIETAEPRDARGELKSQKQVALIIGATGGMGRAACLQLAEDGFDIAIHYHQNRKAADRLKSQVLALGRKAVIVSGDILDPENVKTMIESVAREFKYLTVVCNCAGISVPNVKFRDLRWQDVENQLDVNIKGVFNVLKQVVPIMEQQKYGKVINLSSMAVDKPNGEWLHYITAKSALNGFTKALAFELAPHGIRINLISPGMTDTELVADIPEKVKLVTAAQTPLRRIADPRDVAGAVSFLASTKSDYLTGENIRVNGGQVML